MDHVESLQKAEEVDFLDKCLHRFKFVSICLESTAYFIWQQDAVRKLKAEHRARNRRILRQILQPLDNCPDEKLK